MTPFRFLPLCLIALSLSAHAETIPQPDIKAGDSWTYIDKTQKQANWQEKHTEFMVIRASRAGILQSTKTAGSPEASKEQMTGADWSRFRSIGGKETVVNRPMAFPLEVNKSWDIDYVEEHPNRQHKSEHFHSAYTVVGWEDVKVAAGTFHALKIEADGNWTAELEPATNINSSVHNDAQGATAVVQSNNVLPTTASGRTYKVFWYVPEVKRWVKYTEEYYGSGGQLNERYSGELESYKLAD